MKDIRVNLDDLYLHPHNFRLRSHPDYVPIVGLTDEAIVKPAVQSRTIRLVSGPKNTGIADLMDSIRTNGFIKVDNILVKKLKGDLGYVVIEGNRRVAALKALKQSFNEGFDIGLLDPRIFDPPTSDDESSDDNVGVDV